MKYVVFVPGTMGSVLSTPGGEEVWPPTPVEIATGYKRKAKLLQTDLVVGDIVREVACVDIYEPMVKTLNALGFKETGAGDRLLLFPYDWRRDLEGIADQLAARLDTIPGAVAAITIVAHSMGGLVARLMLETGKFDAKPWFGKIKAFMTVGTPHLGAPLALARILGLDTAMGISAADFKEIAADPRYPSGYQLLPAPREAACWNIGSGSTLNELDIYDDATATKIGLDPTLVKRAAWLHDSLAKGKPPAHIRYFFFAATGHKTATRINVSGPTKIVTRSEDAGDGTVPLWSALPRSGQKQLVVGEHATFFAEENFKIVFYRLFGKDYGKAPVGVAGGGASISVQALTIEKDAAVELVIAPTDPVAKVEGKIVLERTEGPGAVFKVEDAETVVSYAGPPIPSLRVRLPAITEPGLYRIRFVGSPLADKPVQFAVTDK
jgi:pimeloyl-ACP methyl ester carboxylesterase